MRKTCQGLHDPLVNAVLVRLPEKHDQQAMMGFRSVVSEVPVCGDEETAIRLRHRPQLVVWKALTGRAANVADVMAHRPQGPHRHEGRVPIDEDPHSPPESVSSGLAWSSASAAP